MTQISQVGKVLHSKLILLLSYLVHERLQVGVLKGDTQFDLIQSTLIWQDSLIDLREQLINILGRHLKFDFITKLFRATSLNIP